MAETTDPTRSSKGAFAVAAVFALGVVFGAALAVVLLRVQGGLPHPMGLRGGPVAARSPIGRLARELELDADQRRKVEAIMQRSHGAIAQTLEETHKQIRAVLRPDQQEKFDRWRPRGPFGGGGPGARLRSGQPPEGGPPPEDEPPGGPPPPP